MKANFLFFILLSVCVNLHSQDCQHKKNKNSFVRSFADASRSDSLDVLHADLNIDMTHWSDQELFGAATIDLESKLDNVQNIVFDLLALQVDSVKLDGAVVSFSQVLSNCICYAPIAYNTGDAFQATIYYHGEPLEDESGWGGFYWQNDFAFNLGVGFDADPHNFGRAWFPCFDNFVERSTYTLHVLTSENRSVYCGGVLGNIESLGGDSLLTTWNLDQEIPSYLVSIAVGDYVHVTQSFESTSGEVIPIWLAAEAGDTSAVVSSFANLIPCLDSFESAYGPYLWPRVGYVMVPFSSGAMEHAMNIAYPQFAANGGLSNQTLMAHELAHHWWGDLVTCSSQEDMWINEGMASYSEALFIESIDGADAYLENVRDNHKDVLLYAHRRDGERLPVSGIDHFATYGDHVYNKGADVAHTLRGYMNDDFFSGLTAFLENHPYQDVSSEQMRDYLDPLSTGDIHSFFEDWIFQPGFPDIRISSIDVLENAGNYEVSIEIKQFLHYSNHFYTNVPINIEFLSSAWGESYLSDQLISGPSTLLEFTLPFLPAYTIINRNERINQAVLAEEIVIDDDGITSLQHAEFRIDVNAPVDEDSLWIRVENHWSRADLNQNQTGIHLADDRFWRVHGPNNLANYNIEARIRFYGDEDATNYFDPLFFEALAGENMNEDSIRLFHRSSPNEIWSAVNDYELNTQGSNDNWQGYIDFPMMLPGDYAWGYYSDVVGIEEKTTPLELTVYPNPAKEVIFIKNLLMNEAYEIFDASGKRVDQGLYNGSISIEGLTAATYFIRIQNTLLPFVK
jgi:hypothetical protein